MASALVLRRFEPGDLATLQRIREAAFAPIFASFRAIVGAELAAAAFAAADAEQADYLDEICADDSGHHVFLVLAGGEGEGGDGAGGKPVGFVSFTVDAAKRSAELGLNAVHPDRAGRGIGSWMYGEALAKMKALGADYAHVGTGGDPSHAAARRAYAKAGFGPGIESVHYYRML